MISSHDFAKHDVDFPGVGTEAVPAHVRVRAAGQVRLEHR